MSHTERQGSENEPNHRTITAIIVGAGHRALIYASFAKLRPDMLKIVGVADKIEARRLNVKELYDLPDDRVFSSSEELLKHEKMADLIINGTMDAEHVPTSIPLLKKGYDMLLEKPFAINEKEMFALYDVAQAHHNRVGVCHVLRFAPFYQRIKKIIMSGQIGEVINLQMSEHVGYHHLAVSYVRGKWNNEEKCKTTMLLAKCCHDLDIMSWLMNHTAPAYVSSFGSDFQFDESKKPAGAGKRCLVDCSVEEDCLYDAKKHYLDHPERWSFYVWDQLYDENPNATLEDKKRSLKTDNIHGRCCWDCEHTVVDHQSVMIEFANGATGTLNMVGGTSKEDRSIHVIGTKGEVLGNFGDSKLILRAIDPSPGHEYSEERITLGETADVSGALGTHGGGDLRLVEDFVNYLQGNPASISTTTLKDSVMGHLCVFKADESRMTHQTIKINHSFL